MASFPSSYIPTTTASATRAADVLTVPVSGSAPVSLYAEIDVPLVGVQRDVFCFDNLTNGYGIYIGGADKGIAWVRESSVTTAAVSGTGAALAVNTVYKTAGRFSNNDTNVVNGGSAASADTSNSPPATTTLKFGGAMFAGAQLFGYLRRAALWTRALTNAELQAVST